MYVMRFVSYHKGLCIVRAIVVAYGKIPSELVLRNSASFSVLYCFVSL